MTLANKNKGVELHWTSLTDGINYIEWEGDVLEYEVRKLAPFGLQFSGLCHALLPKNIMLKPGPNIKIKFESKINKGKDQIRGYTK